MKSSLLLLGVISMLAGAPARGQYIFMDTNADGVCTFEDYLRAGPDSIDIYLDTNHDVFGTLETCATNPGQPLDISSYDIVFQAQNDTHGSLGFDGWTNALSGFTVVNPFTVAGYAAGVGYGAPIGVTLPPGRYKLGTLFVTVSGFPGISFVGISAQPAIPSPVTGFGSSCDASDFGNTVTLGTDFFDACVPPFTRDDVQATTWGKIKKTYR